MTNVFTTAALSLTMITASTVAFADGHANPMEITCADFGAMELADQEVLVAAITSELDMVSNDETTIGDIQVQCNGMDEKMVAEVIKDGDDT